MIQSLTDDTVGIDDTHVKYKDSDDNNGEYVKDFL